MFIKKKIKKGTLVKKVREERDHHQLDHDDVDEDLSLKQKKNKERRKEDEKFIDYVYTHGDPKVGWLYNFKSVCLHFFFCR